MHLITLPIIESQVPGLGTVRAPKMPVFPGQGVRWGQASSALEQDGRVLVWTTAVTPKLDDIVSQAGAELVYQATGAEVSEAERILSALKSEQAPKPGATWRNRDEALAIYRPRAESVEASAAQARALKAAARVLAMWGVAAGLAFLGRHLGPEGVLLGLTVLSSDGFSGTNGTNLLTSSSSRVMDQAAGGAADSWGVANGGFDIQSNQANVTAVNGNNNAIAYDVTMAATADMRVTVTLPTIPSFGSAFARFDGAADGAGYICGAGTALGTVTRVYRANGSNSFTQLGSDGSAASNGDSFGIDCSGTSISGLRNGSVEVGPVTDSTYASGAGGMRLASATNVRAEDFKIEVASGGSVKTVNGLAFASVKTVQGLAIASVKTINGVATA